MGRISLEKIKVYAHHGCMKEETVIGSDYIVNVWVEVNLNNSAITDDLKDTVDYVLLHKIVVDEMLIPAKLLENVVHRILQRIFSGIEHVQQASVQVSKINPPIGGHVYAVSVEEIRNKKNM